MEVKTYMDRVRAAQKTEITEHLIYHKLAQSTKNSRNKGILFNISRDEMAHYRVWKVYTKRDEKPRWFVVWAYYFISRAFGLTFGIKLMEHGEEKAQSGYRDLAKDIPQALVIAGEEDEHEARLIGMIDEERLEYVGSMIRGLNDALVELTGALAGLTLALQNSRLIAMAGLITGIAASMSMGGTEYLASKSEAGSRSPLKSALYTGGAYVLTVAFLIFPYLVFSNIYLALGMMVLNAIVVIIVFNFYISVAKDLSFWKRFAEMAALSLSIAALSFFLGYLVSRIFGVEV